MRSNLHSSMLQLFEDEIFGANEELQALVESPIELEFGVALVVTWRLVATSKSLSDPIFIISAEDFPHGAKNRSAYLIPQFVSGKERYDFALFHPDLAKPIVIECDGHDFHERTKAQAKRDRSRDRRVQSAGSSILRFTGSEIWASPRSCAEEVVSLVAALLVYGGKL